MRCASDGPRLTHTLDEPTPHNPQPCQDNPQPCGCSPCCCVLCQGVCPHTWKGEVFRQTIKVEDEHGSTTYSFEYSEKATFS